MPQGRVKQKWPDLYQGLQKVSLKIQQIRKKLAGHCIRHVDDIASEFALWRPTEGRTNREITKINHVSILLEDPEMKCVQELKNITEDHKGHRTS